MSPKISQLEGNWEKITNSDCSKIYPMAIEFRNNGLYFAENDPNSPMIIWDVGEYKIDNSEQIRITLANDSSEFYRITISNDTLTFIDPKNCEFKYRKIN